MATTDLTPLKQALHEAGKHEAVERIEEQERKYEEEQQVGSQVGGPSVQYTPSGVPVAFTPSSTGVPSFTQVLHEAGKHGVAEIIERQQEKPSIEPSVEPPPTTTDTVTPTVKYGQSINITWERPTPEGGIETITVVGHADESFYRLEQNIQNQGGRIIRVTSTSAGSPVLFETDPTRVRYIATAPSITVAGQPVATEQIQEYEEATGKPWSPVRIVPEKSEYEIHKEQTRERMQRGGAEGVAEMFRFWASGILSPSNLLYSGTVGEIIFGEPDGKGERLLDIHARTTYGLDVEARKAEKSYGTVGAIFAVGKESYKPGGFGFIGTISALFVGAYGLIGKAGMATPGIVGKTLTAFATKSPWVAGGVLSGLTGVEIGMTKAYEDAGIVEPGRTGKLITERVGQIGLAIGMGYMAASPKTMGQMEILPGKKTLVGVERTLPSGLKLQTVGYKKYVDVFGKRFFIPKTFKPIVSRTIDPALNLYRIPQKTGIVSQRGIVPYAETIPREFGLVPYRGGVPSTQLGFKLAIPPSFFISSFGKDISVGFVYVKPSIVKQPTSKPIIDFSKTPAEFRKPFSFREIIGKPKAMPDITKHVGYPFVEKPIVDEQIKQIPIDKSLSTVVHPKPVLHPMYRAYELLGFGKIKVTPYFTPTGRGLMFKTTITPIFKPIIKPQLPTEPKPYVRAIDKTGKQIGHEFIDLSKAPIIKPDKPVTQKEIDYSLSSKQIHYEETTRDIGDTFRTPKHLRRLIAGKEFLKKGFLRDYETYKGETIGMPKETKSLVLRPTSALSKRYIMWKDIINKPIYTFLLEFKYEPIIKSFKGFKGKTYSLKDLTKKWEMEKSDVDRDIIRLGGRTQQQLLLKKPVVETKKELKPIVKRDTEIVSPKTEKVSTEWLRKIGRLDTDLYYAASMGKPVLPVKPKEGIIAMPLVSHEPIEGMLPVMLSTEKIDITKANIQTFRNLLGFDKIQITLPLTDVELIPDQFQSQSSSLIQTSTQLLSQTQVQEQIQIQMQRQLLGQPQETIQETRQRKRKDISDEYKGIIMDITQPEAYDVFVKRRMYFNGEKRRGISWRKINKYPLIQEDALALGSHEVDNTARATFKIVPVDEKPRKLRKKLPSFSSVAHEYYEKKSNMFIEHNMFRIDSPGEIQAITKRGIAASKNRKKTSKTTRTPVNVNRMVDREVNNMVKKILGV